ncbi:unnamed protein product [Boreogadus saida]
MEAVVSSTTICMLPGLSSSGLAHQWLISKAAVSQRRLTPASLTGPPRVPTSAAPSPLRPPAGSHRLREESRWAGPPENCSSGALLKRGGFQNTPPDRETTTSQVKIASCFLRKPPRYLHHRTGSSLTPPVSGEDPSLLPQTPPSLPAAPDWVEPHPPERPQRAPQYLTWRQG